MNDNAVLSLVRLLYLEPSLAKGILQHVLLNLCGFAPNRVFLLETLFVILASASQTHASRTVRDEDVRVFASTFNPAVFPQHPLLGYKQAGRLATTTGHPPPLVLRRVSTTNGEPLFHLCITSISAFTFSHFFFFLTIEGTGSTCIFSQGKP